MNERAMEYLTCHSEADETDVDGIVHAAILSAARALQKAAPRLDLAVYNPHSAHSNS
jgi:hypothetical protein